MYDLGDQIAMSVTVRDTNGTLINPVTVGLVVTKPDGTIAAGTTVPMPPAITGRPVYFYTTDMVGRHVWRMSTTTPAGSETGVFYVRTSAPRWILSLEEARAQLNTTGTQQDSELSEYLQVTTDIVENIIGPVANLPSVEEVHDGGYAILLNRTPVVSIESITNLADASITYGSTQYVLSRHSGVVRPLSRFAGPVKVTYTAGRANQTPEAAITAAKVIIQHLFRSQQLRPTGPPSPGGNDNTATVPMLGFAVPNAAVQMLLPHSRRRVWVAG